MGWMRKGTMAACMSHDEGNPDFQSSPRGCDCHFHVFGPAGRYPYDLSDLRYAPPHAPVGDFLALAGKLGLERFVFVQPSAYGRDNRCMLDAMREVGAANCRGIVDIDENAPDAVLELLRRGERRCWVKLTGVYRMSVAKGFADAAPMAHALIEAAPDRLIWGSDYPHLSFAEEVDSTGLFDLLREWARDEATLRKILVENPARLYGF